MLLHATHALYFPADKAVVSLVSPHPRLQLLHAMKCTMDAANFLCIVELQCLRSSQLKHRCMPRWRAIGLRQYGAKRYTEALGHAWWQR
jgi:hypothetical protein